MIPALLITLREVIEASLIVATILGILSRLGESRNIKTVWFATFCAFALSIILLVISAMLGLNLQKFYDKHEAYFEGIMMMISALFVTWAVFFLHKHFSRKKVYFLQKVKENVEKNEQKGIFMLVFTAVFREGFEIVLFLSTIYLTSKPYEIFQGALIGLMIGFFLSFALFKATVKMPVYIAFRVSSFLLILFASGLFVRGLHEFMEVGLIPGLGNITFEFIPQTSTFFGGMIQTMLGITKQMNILQLGFYAVYTTTMSVWVVKKKS